MGLFPVNPAHPVILSLLSLWLNDSKHCKPSRQRCSDGRNGQAAGCFPDARKGSHSRCVTKPPKRQKRVHLCFVLFVLFAEGSREMARFSTSRQGQKGNDVAYRKH